MVYVNLTLYLPLHLQTLYFALLLSVSLSAPASVASLLFGSLSRCIFALGHVCASAILSARNSFWRSPLAESLPSL